MTNGEATVTSRQVAENFGRDHDKVRRDIEVILESQSPNLAVDKMFVRSTYTSDRNREYPEFIMNRDGFTLLAMEFTGPVARSWRIKYIAAFNEMEKQLSGPQKCREYFGRIR